jgi:hypothetical protein
MTIIKTLSAIAIVSVAIATPVFAQDAGVLGPPYHSRAYDRWNYHSRAYDWWSYRGAYYQMVGAPYYVAPGANEFYRNWENFGFSGRDRSYPGGEDPSLHPSD